MRTRLLVDETGLGKLIKDIAKRSLNEELTGVRLDIEYRGQENGHQMFVVHLARRDVKWLEKQMPLKTIQEHYQGKHG